MNISTCANWDYLPKAITLLESIKKYNSSYRFNLLCTDSKTETYFRNNEIEGITPFYKSEIPELSDDLSYYVPHSAGYGEDFQYHTAMKVRFARHLLVTLDMENVCLMDADLFFYGDIDKITKEMEGYDIGLIPHMHIPKVASHPAGYYNTGLVYFKNTDNAKKCIDFWKICVCFPDNPYFKTHGTCLDQKYVELFEDNFKEIKELGDTFYQIAPWNYRLFDWSDIDSGMLSYEGKSKALLFAHYSHFKYDTLMDTYTFGEKDYNIFDLWQNPYDIKKLYDSYFEEIKKAVKKTYE